MENFQTKLNLLKLDRAAVVNIKGKTGQPRPCLVVPVGEDTDLVLGEKGAYLNLAHFYTANSQFGDTHVVKVSYPKERREKMTEEEKHGKPFIGNSRPMEAQQRQMAVTTTVAVDCPDDLPF